MKLIFPIFLLSSLVLHAYELGKGYKFNEQLHLGGYFSTDYSVSEDERVFRLDDVAVLAYGSLNDNISYLAELEAAPVYKYEYKTNTETTSLKFHKERFYIDYKYSQNVNFRVGKMITPIGYWNLEPINVLRETSSNPILSNQIFPKFVTGFDIYGYVPNFESLRYNIFAQHNKDLDDEYINIKNKHFFGVSLENEVDYDFSYGGSIAEYITQENKRSRFIEFNGKHDLYPLSVQYEAILSTIKDNTTSKSYGSFASYIQTQYKIDTQNSIVTRYEYFKDNSLDAKSHIGVFGYSYRPIYAVSLKGEYQWNSKSEQNKILFSLSVLF